MNERTSLKNLDKEDGMKRVLCVFVTLLFFAPAAYAQSGMAKANVGCGLGTTIFKNSADDSTVLQAFQATTNGTLGNQTFGVTSGTSECQKPAKFVDNERLNEFVYANLDNLAKDIASGEGETLETLAELMSVPQVERAGFYENLQVHFNDIFPSSDVEYAHVVDTILMISSKG